MPKIDVAAVPVREGLGVCAAARENDSDPFSAARITLEDHP